MSTSSITGRVVYTEAGITEFCCEGLRQAYCSSEAIVSGEDARGVFAPSHGGYWGLPYDDVVGAVSSQVFLFCPFCGVALGRAFSDGSVVVPCPRCCHLPRPVVAEFSEVSPHPSDDPAYADNDIYWEAVEQYNDRRRAYETATRHDGWIREMDFETGAIEIVCPVCKHRRPAQ